MEKDSRGAAAPTAPAQEQEQADKLLDKVRGQMDSAARTKIDQEVAAFRPK